MPPGPLNRFHAWLCAYHLPKNDGKTVIETQHYCAPLGDKGEVYQCIIFDKTDQGAKILGVEYIISHRLYLGLSVEEKKYYHPHTYEVTSGLLLAPGLKPDEELELMGRLLLTWGKTWHTWPDPATDLPMGPPLLMWSATADGQVPARMLADRDKKMKFDINAIRKQRSKLGPVPQIDYPKSNEDLGRQWTNEGLDVKPGK
jgi:hypothetical protein